MHSAREQQDEVYSLVKVSLTSAFMEVIGLVELIISNCFLVAFFDSIYAHESLSSIINANVRTMHVLHLRCILAWDDYKLITKDTLYPLHLNAHRNERVSSSGSDSGNSASNLGNARMGMVSTNSNSNSNRQVGRALVIL